MRLARKRAEAASLEVKFHEGDARKIAGAKGPFDCVIVMGNSFGYFDREEDDLAVLSAIKRALCSHGKLVIDLTDGEWIKQHYEPRSWEWIDENQFVCRERSLSTDGDRLISREVVVHAEKGVIADQFYAERLYSRARIEQLIDRASFSEIRFHEDLLAKSDREGGDLGMMARRMFLTARAPAKTAAKRRANKAPYSNVTVLMGDPRLPDTVKRDGVFNPEDVETIRRLKESLAELDEYRFTYLDNHVTLMSDLRELKPDFVLNFCDEGFNNDAMLELHLPALMDTLGIPYTGAGPVALGLCYNKALVRAAAMACDIPVPLESYFGADDQSATIPSIFPALFKPCLGDSSIGITQDAVVENAAQALAYLSELRRTLPGRPLLIQEFLPGAEYSVGLVGNPELGITALPILEVDYTQLDPALPKILGYESKWLPDSPYWTDISHHEAKLSEDLRRNLIDWSTTLFERLGCRDYARFDFRADAAGQVKLLEVNPNPGWCWDGKLNYMAGFAGYRYADLLRMIIEASQQRMMQKRGGRNDQLAAVPTAA